VEAAKSWDDAAKSGDDAVEAANLYDDATEAAKLGDDAVEVAKSWDDAKEAAKSGDDAVEAANSRDDATESAESWQCFQTCRLIGLLVHSLTSSYTTRWRSGFAVHSVKVCTKVLVSWSTSRQGQKHCQCSCQSVWVWLAVSAKQNSAILLVPSVTASRSSTDALSRRLALVSEGHSAAARHSWRRLSLSP